MKGKVLKEKKDENVVENKSTEKDYIKLYKIFFISTIILSVLLIFVILLFTCILPNINKEKKVAYSTNTPYVHVTSRKESVILEKSNYTLDEYLGESNILVLIWASWCPNCTLETNYITKIINENPEKKIIVISHDYELADLQTYVSDNDLNWYIIYNPDRSIRYALDPEANSVPIAYVLDKDGNIIAKEVGRMDYSGFENLINNYM